MSFRVVLMVGLLMIGAGFVASTGALAMEPCRDVGGVATVCIPGSCQFQSDCCDGGVQRPFWCPPDE